jgi:hypothetical protein
MLIWGSPEESAEARAELLDDGPESLSRVGHRRMEMLVKFAAEERDSELLSWAHETYTLCNENHPDGSFSSLWAYVVRGIPQHDDREWARLTTEGPGF